ncbi:MAG: PepSY domain-containing protein [Salinibacter sp.]
MIDVKEATQIALSYFEDLYGEDAFSNVLLEEIEREKENDTSYWLITVGFTEEKEVKSSSPLSSLSPDKRRRYKRFKIDAETGEVVSMKIRSVENA